MPSSWSLAMKAPPMSPWGISSLVCVVLGLLLLLRKLVAAAPAWIGKRRKLPPGPRGLPLLGNALQLPTTFAERVLQDWGKTFGDVVYFEIFRTPALVLNSIEAARDILDKRSAKYSDRPRMVLLNEMLQAGTLPGIAYGDRFRQRRKWLFDAAGNKATLRGYRDIQRREARRLLLNFSRQPEKFMDHLHLYLAGMLVEITYGRPVESVDDELVCLAERAIRGTDDAGRAGSVPVDFLPILKYIPSWMPGAGFKRNALAVRGHIKEWLNTGYEAATSAKAAGTRAQCLLNSVLAEYEGGPTPAQVEEIKYLAFDVYGAGVATSRGTLFTFMLAMTRNQDVVRKAHEEIDRVVGNERLPDFADRESLPYVNAILEEVYRVYDHPKHLAMTRVTSYYPEPEEFHPERHLGRNAQDDEYLLPSSFVFGFGRRSCPGQALADASIWLAIASIIALFDILRPIDEAGKECTPPAKFISSFSRIVPRSSHAVAILEQIDG